MSACHVESLIERGVLPLEANLDDRQPRAPDRVTPSESETNIVAPLSPAGIVDAILAVGRQRRSLLGEVRSALLSGDDTKALRLARQLCGLQE
jgi:hypothetical protein